MEQFVKLTNRLNRIKKEIAASRDTVIVAALKARKTVIEDQIRMCKAIHKITEPAQ